MSIGSCLDTATDVLYSRLHFLGIVEVGSRTPDKDNGQVKLEFETLRLKAILLYTFAMKYI